MWQKKKKNTLKFLSIPFLYSLPLLQSPFVVIHKALRYKLTCSVDHIIGQAILICCLLGGRVGKDTKRSLKGKSTELMIQNVWNRQTLAEEYEENFLVLLMFDLLPSLGLHTRNLSLWTCTEVDFHDFFSPSKLKYCSVESHRLRTFFRILSTSQVVCIRR